MTKQAPLRLWYTAPAPTACETDFAWQKRQPLAGWEKWSLPLGNSYFGASVFGRIAVERVNVTENSFSNPFYWGVPHWGTGNGGTRTFGNLYFATGHETDKAENFVRDLTLDDAAAHVSYDYEGITYRREYIVSYPDRVLAVHSPRKRTAPLFRERSRSPHIQKFPLSVVIVSWRATAADVRTSPTQRATALSCAVSDLGIWARRRDS